MARYKKGIISETLTNGYATTHKKGDVVYYQRCKTVRLKNRFKLTDYEWYYLDENKKNLIRSTRRIIEGLEIIQEKYVK